MGIIRWLGMGIIVNDIAVMSGRIAGVAIIILGLALGWKSADGVGWDITGSDAIWMFINTALLPVALGILIIVAAEIVLRLGSRNS